MKLLQQKKDIPIKDGRGDPFCSYCGTERIWSTSYQHGYDTLTGKPIMFHQWVCPRWPDEPTKHDCGKHLREL